MLTYNIHKGISANRRNYVLHDIQHALQNTGADILVLQEIVDSHDRFERRFPDWTQTPQFHYLAHQHWDHVAFGENAIYKHGSHGNAVLSRFPIRQWTNIDVTRNRFEQRGILHVEIDLPTLEKPLHLCAVHLNLLGRDRKVQLGLLAEHIDSTIDDGAPLLIAGDFNDWRQHASGELIKKLSIKESHKEVHGHYARTFPAWRPTLSLDRIYFRHLQVKTATRLSGQPWRKLSDHLPVQASFVGLGSGNAD